MTAEQRAVDSSGKERLRRLDRIFPASPIYFVTACAAKRHSILATPSVHRSFLEFAQAASDRGAFVGAYVLMPDHLHLFVALGDQILLSTWVKSLKMRSQKRCGQPAFLRRIGRKAFSIMCFEAAIPTVRNGNTSMITRSEPDL